MLEWIAGLALQSAAPAAASEETREGLRAVCVLTGEARRRTILSLEPVCPQEVPGFEQLQARASAMVAEIDLPLDVGRGWVASEIGFEWQDGEWRLPEAVAFYRSPPDYPRRAHRLDYTGVCDGRVFIGTGGIPEEADFHCQSFDHGRERSRDVFSGAAREAVLEWRFFVPHDGPRACAETNLTFEMSNQSLPVTELTGPEVPVCPEQPGAREN